ncbi:hypothetical protein QO009_003017 [Brevibacillus aydinogluensis]|jgi:hypothetical protein|uniref:hypothetical protein n=1 Tax=Brevibacillus aydinogluensis TaxID=927786 RepID=UPI0028931983|nr:hypothetical protein [Brevibacillus aydinogluensis]MDT3417122.1 hypothetical protein [Brevibacillus aydinogluensis]
MEKWQLLKQWLEQEVVKKYEEANGKNGQEQLVASSFARGMDEVLVKMQLLEKESDLT